MKKSLIIIIGLLFSLSAVAQSPLKQANDIFKQKVEIETIQEEAGINKVLMAAQEYQKAISAGEMKVALLWLYVAQNRLDDHLKTISHDDDRELGHYRTLKATTAEKASFLEAALDLSYFEIQALKGQALLK